MVAWNLLYLIVALVFLTFARGRHIPAVMACESREERRAIRRCVAGHAWFSGGFALSTLGSLYDAQSLMAFVIAGAVTAVATRTTLDYVQLLRWVDQACREGRDRAYGVWGGTTERERRKLTTTRRN